mmetsp:Transcript_6247/g.10772  ORF Transcript_6247/g.10772 Transcript_6247/m.10772 type:complete len:100 (-) Transcript_6247:14-313(-)
MRAWLETSQYKKCSGSICEHRRHHFNEQKGVDMRARPPTRTISASCNGVLKPLRKVVDICPRLRIQGAQAAWEGRQYQPTPVRNVRERSKSSAREERAA